MSISTPYVQVENIIKKYKNNEISVLLMNARNFGAGINLENTDDIIVLHKMNHELEKQVIGRAQRLGRTGPLRVWKLKYTNE
jgi:SNF2 family DNA or RNA helicase